MSTEAHNLARTKYTAARARKKHVYLCVGTVIASIYSKKVFGVVFPVAWSVIPLSPSLHFHPSLNFHPLLSKAEEVDEEVLLQLLMSPICSSDRSCLSYPHHALTACPIWLAIYNDLWCLWDGKRAGSDPGSDPAMCGGTCQTSATLLCCTFPAHWRRWPDPSLTNTTTTGETDRQTDERLMFNHTLDTG